MTSEEYEMQNQTPTSERKQTMQNHGTYWKSVSFQLRLLRSMQIVFMIWWGVYVFFCLQLQPRLIPGHPLMLCTKERDCSPVRVSPGPQGLWPDTQWYRGSFGICSQTSKPSEQNTTAIWAPELVPEQGAFRLQLKLSTSLPVLQTCRLLYDPNTSDSSWFQAACQPCCRWGATWCNHLKKQMDQYRSVCLSYHQKMGKRKSRPEQFS